MAFDNPTMADASGDARFESSASPDEASEASYKFVSFYLDDRHYAVSARSVAEVTGHLTPTPLPDSPHSLHGIAPHRGDILAIVDTGVTSRNPESDKRKAVVLRPFGDAVEMPVAFNVDRIGELLQIGACDIRAASSSDPLADFEVSKGSEKVLIVEPSRIVDLLNA